ncbi:MAG: hypothetical protein AAGE18_18785 [Pseudomonadota bacterium]
MALKDFQHHLRFAVWVLGGVIAATAGVTVAYLDIDRRIDEAVESQALLRAQIEDLRGAVRTAERAEAQVGKLEDAVALIADRVGGLEGDRGANAEEIAELRAELTGYPKRTDVVAMLGEALDRSEEEAGRLYAKRADFEALQAALQGSGEIVSFEEMQAEISAGETCLDGVWGINRVLADASQALFMLHRSSTMPMARDSADGGWDNELRYFQRDQAGVMQRLLAGDSVEAMFRDTFKNVNQGLASGTAEGRAAAEEELRDLFLLVLDVSMARAVQAAQRCSDYGMFAAK